MVTSFIGIQFAVSTTLRKNFLCAQIFVFLRLQDAAICTATIWHPDQHILVTFAKNVKLLRPIWTSGFRQVVYFRSIFASQSQMGVKYNKLLPSILITDDNNPSKYHYSCIDNF